MNPDLEKRFLQINTSVCKAIGMNQKWAQSRNLVYGELQVLHILFFCEPITQKQISEQWMIPKQTVNHTIKRLQESNLVVMVTNEQCKREKLISLTPEGRKSAEKRLRPLFELHERIADSMSTEKINQLNEGLEQYINSTRTNIQLIHYLEQWYVI